MESKIVELRERGRRRVRVASRGAAIALGAGAAIGVAAVGIYIVYRLTRPASPAERVRRLLPAGLAGLPIDLKHARRKAEQRLRRGVPPIRISIGERTLGEPAPEPRWERLVIRAAQAAGTAAAGALASRLAAGLAEGLRGRPGDEPRA